MTEEERDGRENDGSETLEENWGTCASVYLYYNKWMPALLDGLLKYGP